MFQEKMAKGQELEVKITSFNRKGFGRSEIHLSKERASSLEVIGAVSQDELKVKLWAKKKGKWQADLIEVLTPSPDRIKPLCSHVPLCGGCTWQQMSYEAQLKEKQRRLEVLFKPLIHQTPSVLLPILPCGHPFYYRNKMEFSFSQNKEGEKFLGLIIAGSKGRVFHLQECMLASPWVSQVVKQVRKWWEASPIQAYRLDNTGSLRTLTVREGIRTGHKLVMLTVSGHPEFALNRIQLEEFVTAIKESCSLEELAHLSIFLRIQQIHKGSPTQFFEMNLFGPDHFEEQLDIPIKGMKPLQFKISPTSFFQPNTTQAERLYAECLKCVTSPKKHVLDLYSGIATLGIAFASIAEKVTAIEINPHACFDAVSNCELNHISHLEVICGDVGEKLKALSCQPDLVIVDPPRTGLGKEAICYLKQLRTHELLYVSCNPNTQVQDLQELINFGYSIVKLQPVDQFPHTTHIETIAFLKYTPSSKNESSFKLSLHKDPNEKLPV